MSEIVSLARRAATAAAVTVALASMAVAQTAKPAATTPALSAPGKGVERYAGTVANLAGIAGETVTVDLLRWSTDEERDALVATLKDKGDKEFATALAAAPSLGYIWRSGSGFGQFVRFATKWKAADGEHVVIITDNDLATWAAKPGTPATAKYPFGVIELTTAGSAASGKTSLAGTVVADATAKVVRLEDFKAAPVALRGVKYQKGA